VAPTDSATRLIQGALLGEAIDGASIGVFVADEHGRYVAVSEHAAQRLGYERHELLALRVGDIARDGTLADQFAELLRDGMRKGSVPLTRKDGTTVRFDYCAAITTVAHMQMYVSVGLFPDEG
jgi:PAS domain-containing protein